MRVAHVRSYLTKARDFLKGMNLPEDLAERECRYSSALLAIHCAISYSDALRVGLGEEIGELAASDHKAAVIKLEKLLNARKYKSTQGIRQFSRLVGQKTRLAYSPDAFTEDEVKVMIDRARSFSAWAHMTGSQLKIEGWRDNESE
jgi:hypothetical protein